MQIEYESNSLRKELENGKKLLKKHGKERASLVEQRLFELASAACLEDLRHLHPRTKILLRGVANDPDLERYWEHRRVAYAPQLLAGLGISMAIGPNFSHILDVVRTDNMYNRKRQLICLSEFSTAGDAHEENSYHRRRPRHLRIAARISCN